MLCVCTKIDYRGEQHCHMDMVAEAAEVVDCGREMDRFGTFRPGRDQGGFMAPVLAGLSAIGEV